MNRTQPTASVFFGVGCNLETIRQQVIAQRATATTVITSALNDDCNNWGSWTPPPLNIFGGANGGGSSSNSSTRTLTLDEAVAEAYAACLAGTKPTKATATKSNTITVTVATKGGTSSTSRSSGGSTTRTGPSTTFSVPFGNGTTKTETHSSTTYRCADVDVRMFATGAYVTHGLFAGYPNGLIDNSTKRFSAYIPQGQSVNHQGVSAPRNSAGYSVTDFVPWFDGKLGCTENDGPFLIMDGYDQTSFMNFPAISFAMKKAYVVTEITMEGAPGGVKGKLIWPPPNYSVTIDPQKCTFLGRYSAYDGVGYTLCLDASIASAAINGVAHNLPDDSRGVLVGAADSGEMIYQVGGFRVTLPQATRRNIVRVFLAPSINHTVEDLQVDWDGAAVIKETLSFSTFSATAVNFPINQNVAWNFGKGYLAVQYVNGLALEMAVDCVLLSDISSAGVTRVVYYPHAGLVYITKYTNNTGRPFYVTEMADPGRSYEIRNHGQYYWLSDRLLPGFLGTDGEQPELPIHSETRPLPIPQNVNQDPRFHTFYSSAYLQDGESCEIMTTCVPTCFLPYFGIALTSLFHLNPITSYDIWEALSGVPGQDNDFSEFTYPRIRVDWYGKDKDGNDIETHTVQEDSFSLDILVDVILEGLDYHSFPLPNSGTVSGHWVCNNPWYRNTIVHNYGLPADVIKQYPITIRYNDNESFHALVNGATVNLNFLVDDKTTYAWDGSVYSEITVKGAVIPTDWYRVGTKLYVSAVKSPVTGVTVTLYDLFDAMVQNQYAIFQAQGLVNEPINTWQERVCLGQYFIAWIAQNGANSPGTFIPWLQSIPAPFLQVPITLESTCADVAMPDPDNGMAPVVWILPTDPEGLGDGIPAWDMSGTNKATMRWTETQPGFDALLNNVYIQATTNIVGDAVDTPTVYASIFNVGIAKQ